MAIRIDTIATDDISGETGTGVVTRKFSLGDRHYEFEGSDGTWAELEIAVKRFTDVARKAGRSAGLRMSRTSASRQASADIRRWAREQGIAVSDHGRIAGSVIDKYNASH